MHIHPNYPFSLPLSFVTFFFTPFSPLSNFLSSSLLPYSDLARYNRRQSS